MSSNGQGEEQQFKIQPHPQTDHDNNITDGGSGSGPASATQAAVAGGNVGPVKIDDQTASSLEAPKSKEELSQLSAKLNENADQGATDTATMSTNQAPPVHDPAGLSLESQQTHDATGTTIMTDGTRDTAYTSVPSVLGQLRKCCLIL